MMHKAMHTVNHIVYHLETEKGKRVSLKSDFDGLKTIRPGCKDKVLIRFADSFELAI